MYRNSKFRRQAIGPIISQCLILGSTDSNGDVLLLKPSEGSMIGDKVS